MWGTFWTMVSSMLLPFSLPRPIAISSTGEGLCHNAQLNPSTHYPSFCRNLGDSYLLSLLPFPRLLGQPTPSQTLLHRPPLQTPFHSYLGRNLPDPHLPFSFRLRFLRLQTPRPARHLSKARPKDQLRSSSIRVRRREGQARLDWIRHPRGRSTIRSRLLHQQEERDLARRRSKEGLGGGRVQGSRPPQQHRTISSLSSSPLAVTPRLPLQPTWRSSQLLYDPSRPEARRIGRLDVVNVGRRRRVRLGSLFDFFPWTISQLSSSQTFPRPSSSWPAGRPHLHLPLSLDNLLHFSLKRTRRSGRAHLRGGGGFAAQLGGSHDGWKEEDCRGEGGVDQSEAGLRRRGRSRGSPAEGEMGKRR